MANSRIKDMATITPVDGTFVPGDSTGTGTGKATIGAWVLAGLTSALAALTGAITAAGNWTFSGTSVFSEAVTHSKTSHLVGAVTADSTIAAAGAVTAPSVTVTGALSGATATTSGLISAGGGVDFTTDKGVNCGDPTAAQDVATKAYVDKPGVVTVSAAITTTDATATAALTITPTNNAITRYRVSAVCGKSSLNEYGGYEALVVVSKSAGVVTVGSAFAHSTGVTAGIPASDISAVASGADVIFKVTGTAATTLKWTLWVEAVSVTP